MTQNDRDPITDDMSPPVAAIPSNSRFRGPRRDHVYFDDRTGWYIGDYFDARRRRHRRKAGRTLEAARTQLRKWLDEVDKQKAGSVLLIEDITFTKLVEKYWEKVEPKKSPTTQKREKDIKKHLLGYFGRASLARITPEDIEGYQARRKDGRKVSTVNRETILLRHLLSRAVAWRYLLSNPATGVKQLRGENFKWRYLTFEEADRLLACCTGYLRLMVLVSLHSGIRKGELLALKWADIDFKQKVLTVLNSKSGKSRHIDMNVELIDALRSVDRMVGSPYVFCKSDGKPFGDIKVGFLAARKRAGLEDVRWHDLRHTFASWLVIKGTPIEEVMKLLGHASYEMTLRYVHLAPGKTAKAVSSLEGILASPKAQNPILVGTPVAQSQLPAKSRIA